MTREKIINVSDKLKKFSHYYTVHKSAKKDTKSFRITAQLLQTIIAKALKISKFAQLVITIPANKGEKYIVRAVVTKEKA